MEIAITQEKRKEIERIQSEFRNLLSEKEILKATTIGINSTLTSAIGRIKKGVKSNYNISPKYLERMAIVSPKAWGTRLYGGIKINRNQIPLVAFFPKQTNKGVTVTIRKGKPKVFHHAFVATMKSGHIGVFSRGRYSGRKFIHENVKTDSGEIRITQRMSTSPYAAARIKSVSDDVQTYMGKEVVARVEGILKGRVNKLAAAGDKA